MHMHTLHMHTMHAHAHLALCFEVELFSWRMARKEKHEMGEGEKIDEAVKLKEQGTEAFKAGKWDDAPSAQSTRRDPSAPACVPATAGRARTTSLTSAFRIADSSVTRQESVDRSSV